MLCLTSFHHVVFFTYNTLIIYYKLQSFIFLNYFICGFFCFFLFQVILDYILYFQSPIKNFDLLILYTHRDKIF